MLEGKRSAAFRLLMILILLTGAGSGCARRQNALMLQDDGSAGVTVSAVQGSTTVSGQEIVSSGQENGISLRAAGSSAGGSQAASTAAAGQTGDADGSAAQPAKTESDSAGIRVHVCGAVHSPGVYELSGDARVIDAVQAAGGFTADAAESAVNQAQYVNDGAMVRIPTRQEAEENQPVSDSANAAAYGVIAESGAVLNEREAAAQKGSGSGDGSLSSSRVNLNTASKEELMTLSGIGASKADAILRYRQENGGFQSVEDVTNVSGIGSATLSKFRDQVTVGP